MPRKRLKDNCKYCQKEMRVDHFERHYPACMMNPNGKSAIEKRLKKAKKRIEKNEKDREKWWKGWRKWVKGMNKALNRFPRDFAAVNKAIKMRSGVDVKACGDFYRAHPGLSKPLYL